MAGLFFLYDLLYMSFSSFKTEYIYGKQYRNLCKQHFSKISGCELKHFLNGQFKPYNKYPGIFSGCR